MAYNEAGVDVVRAADIVLSRKLHSCTVICIGRLVIQDGCMQEDSNGVNGQVDVQGTASG